MKIAIDAEKAASKNKTGVERLVYELLKNLPPIMQNDTFYFITRDPLPKELVQQKNVKEVVAPYKKFWHLVKLPSVLKMVNPDIFIEPSGYLPPFSPKNSIVFIHDLAFKYFKSAYSKKEHFLLNKTLQSAKNSSGIIFISESTKNDFEKYVGRSNAKTIVSYPGVDADFFAIKTQKKLPPNFPKKYILFIGRLETRKNIAGILKSYKILKEKYLIKEKLVLAGKFGYGKNEIMAILNSSGFPKNDVYLPGFIDNSIISTIYQNASIFLFPSLYEGFGIPVLEAFATKTPVVTSNTSSLPEVAKNSALLCDPSNPADIAKKCFKILNDKNLATSLTSKGLERVSDFSWQKSAQNYKKLIEQII